jgi:hypothetical protein
MTQLRLAINEDEWQPEQYGVRLGPVIVINGVCFHTRAIRMRLTPNGEQRAATPEGRVLLLAIYQIDDGGFDLISIGNDVYLLVVLPFCH